MLGEKRAKTELPLRHLPHLGRAERRALDHRDLVSEGYTRGADAA